MLAFLAQVSLARQFSSLKIKKAFSGDMNHHQLIWRVRDRHNGLVVKIYNKLMIIRLYKKDKIWGWRKRVQVPYNVRALHNTPN